MEPFVNPQMPTDVAEPVAFPTPSVVPGALRKLPVRVPLRAGQGEKIEEKNVLEVVTNAAGQKRYYELGRVLKESIYGQVNHAYLTEPDGHALRRVVPVAIKVYVKSKLRELQGKTQENPVNEISAQQYVGNHRNIASSLECAHDSDYIYSIQEFGGNELYDVVAEGGRMDEARAKSLFRQILDGLAHLQSKQVSHRDLSLENILLTPDGTTCKIIDFGMALRLPHDQQEDGTTAVIKIPPQGVCGKRNYISPEVLVNGEPFDGHASDMWAAGVMLFIMLTGIPPMEAATPLDPRYGFIRDGMLGEMLAQWGVQLPPAAVDLLTRMLCINPSERLTIAEIMQHPWMH